MYGIDIIALRWGIGIFVFFVIVWIIMAKKLLKSEPKAVKVNLADRYDDILEKDLEAFGINSNEFKQMVYVNFKNIHSAFMNCDYDVLREFLTRDLYDYYIEQLELLKKKKFKNIIRDLELVNVKIYDVTNEHDMLRVSVYLNIRMFDYIVSIDTGKCIKGNSNNKIDYEFELSFEKKGSDKSLKNQFLLSKKSCVNDMLVKEIEVKGK